MYEYLTLSAATKKFAAKDFPSPSSIWSTLNKREKAFFDRAMQDKNSPTYKAVMKGRFAHNEMYESNIDQIAIFNIGGKTIDEISTRVFTYDLSEDIKQEWLDDVAQYWNQAHATLPI